MEDKRVREENNENYDAIQKYLLRENIDLAEIHKPILWIHIPYEYNSRNWKSFGSRSSTELNQPYLYLTVKSIIKNCEDYFYICLIDDTTFGKLIPGWNIDMTKIASPVLDNMRTLGLMKLLYIYGGLLCPISFVCMKNLRELYEKGTQYDKMFICENNNRNITSTNFDYYPDLNFCGSQRENETVRELIDFMQRTNSSDYTHESTFLGEFNRLFNTRIKNNKINKIDGKEVGIKDTEENPVLIDNLLSQQYIKLLPTTYGIWIPANDVLKRTKFEWFARLSQQQVLESDTIIGKYLLLSNVPGNTSGVIQQIYEKPSWISFWKVPSDAPYYGLKPNNLGDDITKISYPNE